MLLRGGRCLSHRGDQDAEMPGVCCPVGRELAQPLPFTTHGALA